MTVAHWSLRRRLTRNLLGLVLGGWLATIAIAAVFLDHELDEMFDAELLAIAQTTVLSLDATEGPVIPRTISVAPEDGTRVLRILRAGDALSDGPWPALARDGFTDAPGWRVLRVTAEDAVIEVAHSTNWRREEMLEAASAFLVLVLPLAALLVWGLDRALRRAMAPVEGLARSIGARTPDDLSPVPPAGLPEELQPLVQGMNRHIGRVEDLRRAERQFVANAAHELRTPVAAIRARLELSSDPEAAATVPVLDDLTRRVERLLQLSRSEAGLGLGRGPADLVRVVRLLVAEVGRRTATPLRLDDADLDSLMLPADPDALAILIRNLLENAVDHGTGPVQVTLLPAGGLTIANPTTGTAFHDDAFGKGATSRGAGLGLSIVASLAAAMNARVDKRIAGGRAVVSVRFDRAG